MLRTALTMFGRELMEQAVIDANRVPTLNEGQTSGPSDIFPTADGHVLIAVVGERQFKRWAELMGDEDRWLNDPRFVDDASRGVNRQPLCERLAQWCAERSTAQAVDELKRRRYRPARSTSRRTRCWIRTFRPWVFSCRWTIPESIGPRPRLISR